MNTTASAPVAGQQIFEAVRRERKLKTLFGGDQGLTLLQPDIEAFPNLVAHKLDELVTAKGLFDVQVAFLTYVLKEGSLKDVSTGMVALFGSFFGSEEETNPEDDLKSALAQGLEMSRQTLEMSLALMGAPSDQTLQSRRSPLDRKMKKLARKGQLTYGVLLQQQPLALFPQPA
jgi:uncharacterized surface protein with fasciclin (FAS1) repeats